MVRTVALLFILLQGLFCSAEAGESALLSNITTERNLEETRIILRLSDIPVQRLVTSGQRIDIFLKDTQISAQSDLPDSGRFIRTLIGQNKDELMISFLMRSPPAEVKVLTQKKPSQLIVAIAWKKGNSIARPSLVMGDNGMLSVPSDAGKWYVKSLDGDDWKSFLDGYETPLKMSVPLPFSLADLPQIVPESPTDQSLDSGLTSALVSIARRDWGQAADILGQVVETGLDQRNKDTFLLLYGEALARTGQVEKASGLLREFIKNGRNPALHARAGYLLSYALASSDKPFEAVCQISEILDGDGPAIYRAYGRLLQAEIYLSTEQFSKALEILQKPPSSTAVPWVLQTWNRRLADVFASNREDDRAIALYSEFNELQSLWQKYPFSLAGYAETLYRKGEYVRSQLYFELLSKALKDRPERALAMLGSARAQLRSGAAIFALGQLQEIHNLSPESEADYAASLKILDTILKKQGRISGVKTASQYAKIASDAPSRPLREEAAFKESLALLLGGDHKGGVQALNTFLRHFSKGSLVQEAEGLLVTHLPGVIENSLRNEQDIQALVLVEQNRNYLVRCSLSREFLLGLGKAFSRLGLMNRASKVFFFMIDSWEGRPEEAVLYPFLCRTLFAQGKYEKAADYAGRYLERFAGGASERELFLLRVESLWNSGQLEEAEKLLRTGKFSGSPEVEILASKIYWKLGEHEKVMGITGLPRGVTEGDGATQALVFKAEALFRVGKMSEALPIYEELTAVATSADLALYRRAQIKLSAGDKGGALNLFNRLVDEGRNPYWKKLAGVFLASE